MENRNRILLGIGTETSAGYASEKSGRLALLGRARRRLGHEPQSVGADEGFSHEAYLDGLFNRGIEPDIAAEGRGSSQVHIWKRMRGRGLARRLSQRCRKLIKELFGEATALHGRRGFRRRGKLRVRQNCFLVGCVLNLERLAKEGKQLSSRALRPWTYLEASLLVAPRCVAAEAPSRESREGKPVPIEGQASEEPKLIPKRTCIKEFDDRSECNRLVGKALEILHGNTDFIAVKDEDMLASDIASGLAQPGNAGCEALGAASDQEVLQAAQEAGNRGDPMSRRRPATQTATWRKS